VYKVESLENFKDKSFITFKNFYNLMKPRVMSLVIFTAFVGMILSNQQIDFFKSAISLFFVAIGAGAAGALNMWYDSEIDAVMSRTCLRPIPLGAISNKEALIFGVILSFISVFGLYIFSNFLSAFLLATTISFYIFVYTIWLKRKTTQNIVIGGAAGALPPVIGWTIINNNLSLEPIILFLIIFLWTPSHFWALSLYKTEDYKKAQLPMLPVVFGEKITKKNIFIYSIILFPVSISPYFLNFAGNLYLIFSSLMGLIYIYMSFNLLRTKIRKNSEIISKKIFGFSIIYLFMLFFVLLVERIFI